MPGVGDSADCGKGKFSNKSLHVRILCLFFDAKNDENIKEIFDA